MKKLFLIIGIGLISSTSIFAQKTPVKITPKNSWFKAGLTAGVPVGDASDIASFNVGLDLRGQYLVTPNLAIGGVSGYNHYFAKDEFDDFGIVPLAGFARYYFKPKGIFIGTDVGFGLLTGTEDNDGGLYVNPHIGYHNRDWNLYAFYQNTFAENDVDLQNVGVGVTYNIRFK